MKKIPSLFKRDYDGTRLVYDEVTPGCEWVIAGEGFVTVKWDGTSCMIRDGALYRRYELKPGKVAPDGFIPAQDPDPVTGKQPGWVRVKLENSSDRWHIEALARMFEVRDGVDGTYELVGPKVQGNPHGLEAHELILHGTDLLFDLPGRDFDAISDYLTANPDREGIVFWRDAFDPGCDKCKIKRRDFGLPWPVKTEGAL